MYLFIFYCVFLFALFIVPSYITYKRTGINPFKFSKEETAINYVGKAYKIISAIAFITIALNAFLPSAMKNLIINIESISKEHRKLFEDKGCRIIEV